MRLRKGAFFHGAKADGCFSGLLVERIGLELDAMRAHPFRTHGSAAGAWCWLGESMLPYRVLPTTSPLPWVMITKGSDTAAQLLERL